MKFCEHVGETNRFLLLCDSSAPKIRTATDIVQASKQYEVMQFGAVQSCANIVDLELCCNSQNESTMMNKSKTQTNCLRAKIGADIAENGS